MQIGDEVVLTAYSSAAPSQKQHQILHSDRSTRNLLRNSKGVIRQSEGLTAAMFNYRTVRVWDHPLVAPFYFGRR
jgi:hypothetical protein